jgi:hypothetical protein
MMVDSFSYPSIALILMDLQIKNRQSEGLPPTRRELSWGKAIWGRIDQPTNQPTDQRTDKVSYRGAMLAPRKGKQKIELTASEIQYFCILFQLHPDFSQLRPGCN